MKHYDSIGIDFKDEHGVRVTTIQRVSHDSGKAIATVSFDDGVITRILCCDHVDKDDFEKCAREILANSTPIQFFKTQMPDKGAQLETHMAQKYTNVI